MNTPSGSPLTLSEHSAATAAMEALRVLTEDVSAASVQKLLAPHWPTALEPSRNALLGWAKIKQGEILDGAMDVQSAISNGLVVPVLASFAIDNLLNRTAMSKDLVAFSGLEEHSKVRQVDQLQRAADLVRSSGENSIERLPDLLKANPFAPSFPDLDPTVVWNWLTNHESTADSLRALEAEAQHRFTQAYHQLDGAIDNIAARTLEAEYALNGLSRETQKAAAGDLIAAYASEAATAKRVTWFWNALSVLTGFAAIGLAIVYIASVDHSEIRAGEAIARAALTASVLFLAGFFARMASHARRDATNWTHMGLQLSTAQGYIQQLPSEQRAEIQHALALRFFPGQPQDPHGSGSGSATDAVDLAAIVAALRTSSGAK